MPCPTCGNLEPLPKCPCCQTTATELPFASLFPVVLPEAETPQEPVFRFANAPSTGDSASHHVLGKRCPRCGLGHRLETEECERCGRPFQTAFVLKPPVGAKALPRRGKPRGWWVCGLAALTGLMLWMAVLLVGSAHDHGEFVFACTCYGQDQARHELGGSVSAIVLGHRAAYWRGYARSHFISGTAAFPGGERVLLYDQSRGNIPVGLIVMRRAGGDWQRLPDDAGLSSTSPALPRR